MTQIPLIDTLKKAAQLSIREDKPIMLDYYECSLEKKCKVVRDELDNKILYKDASEYTSPLKHMYSVEHENQRDLICETNNSIYIVSAFMLNT